MSMFDAMGAAMVAGNAKDAMEATSKAEARYWNVKALKEARLALDFNQSEEGIAAKEAALEGIVAIVNEIVGPYKSDSAS